MPVSIKDIARRAGVSHSTVSRALRGSALIPADTTARIRTLADEMGYSASAIGRGLAVGRTEALGLVVTSIADPFNGEMVAGVEDTANQLGYSVILATSQAQPERELSAVREFQSRRVDGLIVASSRVGARYSDVLAGMGAPVVLLNNQHAQASAYSVCIDNNHGAALAAEHLLSIGHRRIAYLGDPTGLHSDEERRAAFLKTMRNAKVDVPSTYLIEGNGKADAAERAFVELVRRSEADSFKLPTAIFCYNDLSAIGVIQAARQLSILIPDQVSIIGFDDIQMAEFITPRLSTIRQPKKELGAQSVRLLFDLMRGQTAENSMMLKGELILRESTRPVQPR